jgi:hypothetical protein
LAATAVAPALSPCQALLKPTSCELRRSLEIVIRPPRLGTSCHISPLACAMSTGFTIMKVAMYCPLPPVSAKGLSRSVMSVLCESLGSSSPKARPITCSYAMSWPDSDTVLSMMIRVTLAWLAGAQASSAAPNPAAVQAAMRSTRESLASMLFSSRLWLGFAAGRSACFGVAVNPCTRATGFAS